MSLTFEILRHGIAGPSGSGGDRQRPLSRDGARLIGRLANRLAREGWAVDHAYCSPLRRARETAAIICREAGAPPPPEALACLEPDAEPSDVLDALSDLGVTRGRVLLVGHQPLLGRLVGHLTGRERGLSPGTLLRIECPMGAGQGVCRLTSALEPEEYAEG